MASSFKMEGLEKMLVRLERLEHNVDSVEDFALREAGKVVKTRMEQGVNRSSEDQPHTEDNISLVVKDVGGQRTAVIAPNSKVAWRAKFLEFGTSKMNPSPFIEPAVDESKTEVRTVIATVLEKGFKA